MSEGHVQVTATDVTDAQRQTTITLEPTTTPGYFTGQLRQLPDGQYRIEPTGAAVDALLATDDSNDQVAAQSPPTTDQAARPATSVQVRSRMQRELIDTRCDLAFAQKLAQATGGQILPPTAISEVVALTDLTPLISETTTEELLWPRWYWLAAIFACLNIEWITRKLRGLS